MATEVITRRHLPHWYVPGAAHFVTYRLAGTIPVALLKEWREQREATLRRPPPEGVPPGTHREHAHKRFFARFDYYLDNEPTIDWLRRPEIAAIVRGNLYHHDNGKYHLLAWCIMPNHVHVLFQPTDLPGPSELKPELGEERCDALGPLASIMHSLKSYTANKANEALRRTGSFWQGESYDHWVRDEEELERIIEYIRFNPVKAGLVVRPEEWFFCSAHDRFLQDGAECGLLLRP
jgi:putative DNA methylase